MKQYKVIALSVGGNGNKIHDSLDIVSEDGFVKENIPALIAGGFIEEYEAEKPEKVEAEKPKHKK